MVFQTRIYPTTVMRILDVGGKNGVNAETRFPKADITIIDKCNGWDVMEKGLPDGEWDIILASHFIEHIVDPDYFLDECKRVMKPSTVLEIDTPNMAAWFNRILLLLGYLPHFCEVSTRYDVGKFRLNGSEAVGGHLRIFTLGALLQLLKKHGFKVFSVRSLPLGYPLPTPIKQVDRLFGRFPSMAAELRVRCGYSA